MTNNHLNDDPGFLLPAYNYHCTKCLEVIITSQEILILKLFIVVLSQHSFLFQMKIHTDLFLSSMIFVLRKTEVLAIIHRSSL